VRDRSLLRERDFGLLVVSIGVSALGDWVAAVALVLQIQNMTGSGLAVSGLLICLWSPIVILAAHAGLLVDRVETTRLLALVSLGQAVVAAALAFAGSAAAILPLTALLGTGFAVAQAAEFALVPAVARGRVQEANGHVETARYVGLTAGPIVGGVLVAAGGVSTAMLVNAASFVLLALVAATLRARRVPAAPDDGEPLRARDGVATLLRDRLLRLAMGVAFASLLFMSASIPADVFYVKDVLDMGDVAYGVVLSTWTAGMLVGALVLARRVRPEALVAAAFAAVAVQGLGKALTPLWLVFPFMVGCYLGAGMAHGLKNVMFRTLIHTRVPERLHGRAFAAYNGIRNTAELGALAAGGVLVAAIGSKGTLWLAGGASALAGLAGLVLLPRRSRLAAPESDASTIGSP
jgi:Na+/melibiose symporter-like transporter